MRTALNLVIIIFTLAILQFSCNSDRCLYSAGKNVTEILSVDSFTTMNINGIFDVELVQDTTYYVEGVAGENVIDNIEAQVTNDTLNLNNCNHCFWFRDYKRPLIRVHSPNLIRINMYEASYLFSTDTITSRFSLAMVSRMGEVNLIVNNDEVFEYTYTLTGGRFIFRGKTKFLNIQGYYTSLFDASGLVAKKAFIKNVSIVDYKVWVTDELSVAIYNRGNVLYKGDPQIIIDTLTSTGRVLKY
jgi:hypothetical protein